MKTVIGIDFGLKKIGIARSDPEGITTRPLTSIKREEAKKKLNEIENEGWDIIYFVVGYPLNTDGTRGEITEKVEEFIENILLPFKKPVYCVDERYSSIEAEEFLNENPHLKKKYDDNSISAAIILIRFFQYGKNYVVKKWDENEI